MFYKNPETGEVTDLTADNAKIFNLCIKAIAQQKTESIKKALDKPSFYFLPHSYDENGSTLLQFAITEPNDAGVAIASLLIEHGADIKHKDNHNLNVVDELVGYLERGQMTQEIHDAFCRALDLRDAAGNPTTDSRAVVRALIHEESVREVEAEYAARAEAETEAKETAYKNADFDGKVAIDPLRAMDEHAAEQRAKGITDTLNKITIGAVTDTAPGEGAIQAVKSLYAKSDQLVYPVNDALETLLQDMFGSKKSDVDTDTKHSVLGSLCDWLGIDLSQLSYLVSLASGSGFLPFYHVGHGNPDDDFGNGPFGGNSAVFFGEVDQPSPAYIVTILGNGTIVITDEPQ